MIRNSEIFSPYVEEVLYHVSTACRNLGIDFYLAGAVARDYHLAQSQDYKPKRKTVDVDIAVVVVSEDQFIALKQLLITNGEFQPDEEPIRLLYKGEIELDLLPCGTIEKEGETRLTEPRVFVLDVPGFALLNDLAIDVAWSENVSARVCPLEGIVLLKLFAWNDRKERTKDLHDINSIISLYFDNFSSEIYDTYYDVLLNNDSKNPDYIRIVCAEVIGIKIKSILAPDPLLYARVADILKQNQHPFWKDMLRGLSS